MDLILEIVDKQDLGELSALNDVAFQRCVRMFSALDCGSNQATVALHRKCPVCPDWPESDDTVSDMQ